HFGEETGIGIPVRIERLLIAVEFADGEFAKNTDAFLGMTAQGVMAALFVDGVAHRFKHQDANAPDVAVLVQAGVGPLFAPVAGLAEARNRQLAPQLLAIRWCRRR